MSGSGGEKESTLGVEAGSVVALGETGMSAAAGGGVGGAERRTSNARKRAVSASKATAARSAASWAAVAAAVAVVAAVVAFLAAVLAAETAGPDI